VHRSFERNIGNQIVVVESSRWIVSLGLALIGDSVVDGRGSV
jgi:hypothetical protein